MAALFGRGMVVWKKKYSSVKSESFYLKRYTPQLCCDWELHSSGTKKPQSTQRAQRITKTL
jgi:hypothetical protein